MSRITVLVCVFAAVSVLGVVNVRQSDDSIREQLLRHTPPGTPAPDVFEFLQHGLRHAPGTHVAGAPHAISSFMVVDLGHYMTLASLYTLGPMVVQATWRFDEHDKLRDIEVRRFLTGL